jgi:predicted Zn-dependent protease
MAMILGFGRFKFACLAIFAGLLVSCATTNLTQKTTRFIIEGNSAALRADFVGAAAQYEAALKVDPENSTAKRNLGIVLVKVGDYKRAHKNLSAVQEEYKTDVEVFYFLGEASRGSGDFRNALAEYTKASKISPKDLRVQKALAWTQFRLGQLDRAFSISQRLHRGNPDDLQIKLIFASVLNKQRKYDEVQVLLASVEKSKFSVQSKDKVSAETERTLLMNALAEAYVGVNNCSKAEPMYVEILKARPFLAPALIGAAKCDLKGKQRARATSRLERAIKADPATEEAYFLLGQLYEPLDKSKATYFYKRFLLLAKDNPRFVSESRITRSNLVNLEKATSR